MGAGGRGDGVARVGFSRGKSARVADHRDPPATIRGDAGNARRFAQPRSRFVRNSHGRVCRGRSTQIQITMPRSGSSVATRGFRSRCSCSWLVHVGVLSKTVTGRHLYALGGNEAAARLCGIRTRAAEMAGLYHQRDAVVAGGGVVHLRPKRGRSATLGRGYELNAIAASVVGGCSLAGGVGTVPGGPYWERSS